MLKAGSIGHSIPEVVSLSRVYTGIHWLQAFSPALNSASSLVHSLSPVPAFGQLIAKTTVHQATKVVSGHSGTLWPGPGQRQIEPEEGERIGCDPVSGRETKR